MCKVNIPKTVFGYFSDISSTYDALQSKEKDLRDVKQPNVNPNANINNMNNQEIISKSSMFLNDGKN